MPPPAVAPAPPAPPAGDPPTPPAGDPPAAAPPGTPPAAAPPGDPPTNVFADLGDTWRTDMLTQAGFEGDDLTARQGQMDRVLDIGTFAKNYFSAQDKIRAGELSSGLPADPSEEQLTEWRAANDVPEKADGYELSLEEGLVLGDEDKAIVDAVFEVGHAGNISTAVMSGMVSTFLKGREAEMDAVQQQDGIHKMETTTQLKKAWKGDFETNINMVKGFVSGLPEAIRESFEGARLADGRAMFNSPEVMVFFADKARQLNPSGTVVPNSLNPVADIESEITELEGKMGEDGWHKDKKGQARYLELVDVRDQMKQQRKAGEAR